MYEVSPTYMKDSMCGYACTSITHVYISICVHMCKLNIQVYIITSMFTAGAWQGCNKGMAGISLSCILHVMFIRFPCSFLHCETEGQEIHGVYLCLHVYMYVC